MISGYDRQLIGLSARSVDALSLPRSKTLGRSYFEFMRLAEPFMCDVTRGPGSLADYAVASVLLYYVDTAEDDVYTSPRISQRRSYSKRTGARGLAGRTTIVAAKQEESGLGFVAYTARCYADATRMLLDKWGYDYPPDAVEQARANVSAILAAAGLDDNYQLLTT